MLIADWLGASHWSKPSPRKLPGVTGLAAYAGVLGRIVARVATSAAVSDAASQERVRVRGLRNVIRGSIYISRNVGKLRHPNPVSHTSNTAIL